MSQSNPSVQELTDRVRFTLYMYQLELQQTLAELAFHEVGCKFLSQNIRDLVLISQETLALWESPTAADDEPTNPF